MGYIGFQPVKGYESNICSILFLFIIFIIFSFCHKAALSLIYISGTNQLDDRNE